MSLTNLKNKFNWKYILREILLIFIGINLAIWFNNWNASRKSNQAKSIAISKIQDEIESNTSELKLAQKNNGDIVKSYAAFKSVFGKNTSELISTPVKLQVLNNNHPGFFIVQDSVALPDGLFKYSGKTFINLELPSLTEIAWETTKSINVTNDFDYERLYDLASMYNLQKKVLQEIDKAANALQKRELKELMHILDFLDQLGLQLLNSYDKMLKSMENSH